MIANPRAATVSKRVQRPDIVRLYPLLLPDGSVRNVHIVARVPRDESGNAELVGAVMNIIEHHSSRAALQGMLDQGRPSALANLLVSTFSHWYADCVTGIRDLLLLPLCKGEHAGVN